MSEKNININHEKNENSYKLFSIGYCPVFCKYQ